MLTHFFHIQAETVVTLIIGCFILQIFYEVDLQYL